MYYVVCLRPTCTAPHFHCATPCTVTSSPLFVCLIHISATPGTVLGSGDSCYLQTILSFLQDEHKPRLVPYSTTFIVRRLILPSTVGISIITRSEKRVLITTSSSIKALQRIYLDLKRLSNSGPLYRLH